MKMQKGNWVFIGNLPFDFCESSFQRELLKLSEVYGPLEEIKIFKASELGVKLK